MIKVMLFPDEHSVTQQAWDEGDSLIEPLNGCRAGMGRWVKRGGGGVMCLLVVDSMCPRIDEGRRQSVS